MKASGKRKVDEFGVARTGIRAPLWSPAPGTLDQLKGGLDFNRAFQWPSIAGSFVRGHDSGSEG
jgi:hypothetical protein